MWTNNTNAPKKVILNTASTVLHLFGVEQPLSWTGEVPMSILI